MWLSDKSPCIVKSRAVVIRRTKMDNPDRNNAFPELDYIYGEESKYYSFVSVPKELVTGRYKGLSAQAQILYIKMLDRLSISVKNGWNDEKGRTYIYYTLEAVMKDLSCGHNTATKLLRELDTGTGAGLIERKKQGQGKPTRIYVKSLARLKKNALCKRIDIAKLQSGGGSPEVQKEAVTEDAEIRAFPRSAKKGSQDRPKEEVKTALKGQRNNTNSNNTEFINHHQGEDTPGKDKTFQKTPVWENDDDKKQLVDHTDETTSFGYNGIKDNIKDQVTYDRLIEDSHVDKKILNAVIDVMAEVKTSAKEAYIIHKKRVSACDVKKCFEEIKTEDVLSVLRRLSEYEGSVSSLKPYILSALYTEMQARSLGQGSNPSVSLGGYKQYSMGAYGAPGMVCRRSNFPERHYTAEQFDELERRLLNIG